MKVALVGTGLMGAGMARSMHRTGLDVTVWNRTRAKAEPLAEDGITVADSIGEAVGNAEAVVTMLFDADAVLSVTPELVDSLGPNSVWMQSSTVGPDGMTRIAKAAGEAALLDAPMLGTRQPAEQGRLVPIVSGDPRLVERVRPVLDAVGTKTVVAGETLGKASALKLACNAWILSITAATAQSVALAGSLGVDPAQFLEAIDGGPTNSPYAQIKGRAMMAGDFSPAFGLDGGRKDLTLIAEAARGIDRSLLDGVRRLFDEAAKKGHGGDDLAAVYTAFS
jgi:3-hydroxyisobutyrate dehydrogenase